jgi:hypothetical protein
MRYDFVHDEWAAIKPTFYRYQCLAAATRNLSRDFFVPAWRGPRGLAITSEVRSLGVGRSSLVSRETLDIDTAHPYMTAL